MAYNEKYTNFALPSRTLDKITTSWIGNDLRISVWSDQNCWFFINRKVFRRTTDLIITAWESFTVSVLEIVFGVRTYVTGDAIRSEETSLIILNHPTRLDWGFLWCALLHSSVPPAHNAKFVIKDAVKNIPGIGKFFQ